MTTKDMLALCAEKSGGFAVATYNTPPTTKIVGDSLLTEHSVLLGQGSAVKVAVFSPKSLAAGAGGVSVMPFGQKVVLVGFSVAVRKGYLQCSASSVEPLT
jgi:hypothetical protein